MSTNSIPYFDQLVNWSNSLNGAPVGVLVFLLCIAFGYVWRGIRVFPNRFTPAAVMVAGGLAMTCMTILNSEPWQHYVRSFVIGFIIGFIAWLVHRLVIKRIEKKFGLPELGESFDTETITKDEKKEP